MIDKVRLLDITAQNVSVDKPLVTPELEPIEFGIDEICPGKSVTLHFSLALADNGSIIDSNFTQQPATFVVGDGNLLATFERVLWGLKEGAERCFVLSSKEAFGEINEDNIQQIPRNQFSSDLSLIPGLMINFTDAAGNGQAAVVSKFTDDEVTMDFNHPLAGKDIEFKVAIIKISTITS